MTAQNGNFPTFSLLGLVPIQESGSATHKKLMESAQLPQLVLQIHHARCAEIAAKYQPRAVDNLQKLVLRHATQHVRNLHAGLSTLRITGWPAIPGPLKFRTSFFALRFGHPDFIFHINSCINGEEGSSKLG